MKKPTRTLPSKCGESTQDVSDITPEELAELRDGWRRMREQRKAGPR